MRRVEIKFGLSVAPTSGDDEAMARMSDSYERSVLSSQSLNWA